jgi:hypothetical protein
MTDRPAGTGVVPFPAKIVELHRSLRAAGLRYAFGGALALAWCTPDARGTIDIDVNVFITDVDRVLAALPDGVHPTASQRSALVRDGQARLMWEGVPIDIFLSTTEFHDAASRRTHVESYGGEDDVPFLDCSDLAVFKAFFNRSKDWVDLEEMVAAGTLDGDRALGVLLRYLGGGDERIERLRRLLDPGASTPGV